MSDPLRTALAQATGTCAGNCNPYVAACGARFCTYEEMQAHVCQPATGGCDAD